MLSDELRRNLITSSAGFGPWFETYGRIKKKAPELNPETNRIESLSRPTANLLQQRFARVVTHCLRHNLPIRIIMLKPRQKGCSTISVAFLYWMVRRLGIQGMVIGGQYDQTDELWKILTRYRDHDAFEWLEDGVVNERRAKFDNGGIIEKRTAGNENAGRAGNYQAVIVTELGRWKEDGHASAGEVLQGVQATVTLAPNTAVILESTARGNTGVFYEQWQAGIDMEDFLAGNYNASEAPFVRIFAPAYAFTDSRMKLTPEQRTAIDNTLTDDERWRMSEFGAPHEYIAWRRYMLKQECRGNETRMKFDFPDTPEEAFHASSETVFSTVAIRKMREVARGYTGMHGVLRCTETDDEGQPLLYGKSYALEPREEGQGEVVIYDRPEQGLRYLLAVDPMTGIATSEDGRERDHHAGIVLRDGYFDVSRGAWRAPKIVARTRPPSKNPEWNCQWGLLHLERIIFALHRYYGGCLTAVERNKDGGLIRGLWEHGCHLYSSDKSMERGGETMDHTSTEKLGFLTVGGRAEETRNWILEHLEDAVARFGEDGQGIDIPDVRTLDEMEVFIVNKKGRKEAAPGEHDDSVMALAIAFALRKQGTVYTEERLTRPLPPELARLEARRRGGSRPMYS